MPVDDAFTVEIDAFGSVYRLPYGRPLGWDNLSHAEKWMIWNHQQATVAWWRRVLSKPVTR